MARDGRLVACEACGQVMAVVTPWRLDEDVARRRYLLDELAAWARAGQIDEATRAQLAEPYEAELRVMERSPAVAAAERRAPEVAAVAAAAEAEGEVRALAADVTAEVQAAEIERASRAPAGDGVAEQVARVAAVNLLNVLTARAAAEAVSAASLAGPTETGAAREAAAREAAAQRAAAPEKPHRSGQILRELRPVFYENLVLFLGAFLVFAGSIYFAVYFWDRLGAFGPLVAGGLLSLYGLGFAGAGYLLQRRYHADLSARVLYGVATAVLPIASTLLGEPLRTASPAVRVLAGAAVTALCAVAYPAIVTAASLFQREIGKPFARAFIAGLWLIGLAPLAGLGHAHAVELGYVYLATLPVLAMYRQVREVGRVFERATVIYVVGGSAYLIAAVAARVALSASLTAPELAPLAVLLATAAIDLDVAWRRQSRAARSALGVVGVLAHATAIGAIALAAGDPWWRVVTTLLAGLVFAVTALRHRRPSALHFAFATLVASGWMIAWLLPLDQPQGLAFGGLILLPLVAGLARLAARWRKHAAHDYAGPCERWAMLTALSVALATALPFAYDMAAFLVDGHPHAAAPVLARPPMIVLPATAAVLAVAWVWGRRRPYLAGAALAASATALIAAHLAGAGPLGLLLIAAGLATGLSAVAATRTDSGPPLVDAALGLLATSIVALGAAFLVALGVVFGDAAAGTWTDVGPLAQMACFAAIAVAAAAVASQRARGPIELIAALGVAATVATGLGAVVPDALIAGVLALVLLALDRLFAQVTLGQARPLRRSFALAVIAVAIQVIVTGVHADTPAALSPAGAGLVALALLVIAARRRSPWPSYAAIGCLALAGYGAPAAADLAIAPRATANAAVLAVIIAALLLRSIASLRTWRRVFLDVPLHFAALAAPILLVRAMYVVGDWAQAGAPASHLVLRRVASPLALAVLAAITHGSRLHAYLAAAAAMLVLPAVVAWFGPAAAAPAVAAALAASAVLAWLGRAAIARGAWFERPVVHDDLPLPLLGYWPLPTASSVRALWRAPLAAFGLAAALAAAGLALGQTIDQWPVASPASVVALGLLAVYAIGHAMPGAAIDRAAQLAMHAACAAIALLCAEAAHLTRADAHGLGLVALAAGYLIASELTARSPHRMAQLATRAMVLWAIALSIGPATILSRLGEPAMPLAGAVLAIAVVRRAQRSPSIGTPGDRPILRPILQSIAASLSITWAAGLVVLWLLRDHDWLAPHALAALAVTAAVSTWAHWLLRARLAAPIGLASCWAVVAGVLALRAHVPAPAIAALGLSTAWFGFAAVRTGAHRYGYAAEAALVALYVALRISPLGASLTTETDVIVAVVAAFVLHFAAELLQRARLASLVRPATLGANGLPLVACALALASIDSTLSTVQHAVLAETLGVLYTLSARRGNHPLLGALALVFYNAGLVLLWICTHRHDALYYTVPVGLSIGLLARIYQQHLSRGARRGLRAAGALLIYFSTYYYVVQFDNGRYPLLLGVLAFAGIAAGFWLELRELFGLSIGFLVLDVISNLAYYGAHRPVLGWTLLTLAGLLLTASGVVFQLRRAQIRSLVADVRASLARWD